MSEGLIELPAAAIPVATVSTFRAKGPPVIAETLEGEAIVINLETGAYYSLRGVGAQAWELFAEPVTLADLAERVAVLGGWPVAEVAPAVAAMVRMLLEEGLIVAEPAAAPGFLGPPDEGTGTDPVRTALAIERYTDVQELLALDPVHDVDEVGWPVRQAD